MRNPAPPWLISFLIAALLNLGFSGYLVGRGAAQQELIRYEFQKLQMGTKFRIVFYASEPLTARKASTLAFDRLEELEQIFSDYRSDSEVSTLIRQASKGPVIVGQELFELLVASLHLSDLTGGAFDPTVKPLVELWRIARAQGELPSFEELAKAKARVGYKKVLLNPRLRSVRFEVTGLKLDFGGNAKGYAADQLLLLLSELGIHHVLIDAGGDLRLGLSPPGQKGWRVSVIQDGDEAFELVLSETAVATSSDSYQFVEIGGTRYSHIVDPITGLGVSHAGIVTVVAPTATEADGFATALSVMGPQKGLELVDSLDGIEARWRKSEGGRDVIMTSRHFPP